VYNVHRLMTERDVHSPNTRVQRNIYMTE